MRHPGIRSILSAVCMGLFVAGCGGTSDSGGTGGTGVTSGVVTAYGSIVVNGVHYDETSANVVINDAAGAGDHHGIKLGMTVKVKGSSNGTTGTATEIEAEHAVEGLVASTNNIDTLTVLGQTVIVDGQTRYEPAGTSFATFGVGFKVEVYGLRDQNNTIHASLIEVVSDGSFEEELRGFVTNLNTTAMTFEINGYPVRYDNTTVYSSGGSMAVLANGLTVEVHLNTAVSGNLATEIEFEDYEDTRFNPANGAEYEIEGYVSTIIDASTFVISGRLFQTTLTTVYENGTASDLAVGRKIHVKGRVNGSLVVVEKIEF